VLYVVFGRRSPIATGDVDVLFLHHLYLSPSIYLKLVACRWIRTSSARVCAEIVNSVSVSLSGLFAIAIAIATETRQTESVFVVVVVCWSGLE